MEHCHFTISEKQKGVTFEIAGCDIFSLQSKGQDLYELYGMKKIQSKLLQMQLFKKQYIAIP